MAVLAGIHVNISYYPNTLCLPSQWLDYRSLVRLVVNELQCNESLEGGRESAINHPQLSLSYPPSLARWRTDKQDDAP